MRTLTTWQLHYTVGLYTAALLCAVQQSIDILPAGKFAAVAHARTDGRTLYRFMVPASSLSQIGDLITARKYR